MTIIGLVFGLCALPFVVSAQQVQPTSPQAGDVGERSRVISPILTIDSDRVFWDSAFGKRVQNEITRQQNTLEAENTKIRDTLAAEEKELTAMRADMEPDAFRVLADAFDLKVQETYAAQNAKGVLIQQLPDQERVIFLNLGAPVFERLMRETGAAVILERRSVFVSASAIEITDAAIAALDATIGDGSAPDQ